MTPEEKSAAIVAKIMDPGYAHAENIFRMFNERARQVGDDAALDEVYREVVDPTVSH